MIRRAAVAFGVTVLIAVALTQIQPDTSARTIHISGRLLDPDGAPVRLPLRMQCLTAGSPKSDQKTVSSRDGRFQFVAVPGLTYRIYQDDGGMELHTKTVETSNQDVAMGDIFLESCIVRTAYLRRPPAAPKLTGKLRLEQIVIDAEKPAADVQVRPPGGLPPTNFKPGSTKPPRCWTGPSLDRRSEWESLCSVEFGRYLSIESFVGGSVKLIRVVRYGEYATPNLTPSEIKNIIQKVWFGLFDTAYCQIPWAEMNDWNIEASVEFEDGKRTSLLTGGGHVEVEDREGKHWFIRLGD